MNFRKYLNSAALNVNPLCGISTYKDTLNLATGSCTRYIKKIVLDGSENWANATSSVPITKSRYRISNLDLAEIQDGFCSHYAYGVNLDNCFFVGDNLNLIYIVDTRFENDTAGFKNYLAEQYSSGTPVTIWYVLATPTTETISLPSGLSGTLEGSLTQSGTPTPSAPIYPTAITGEGWYNINTYKRSVLVWNTDTTYERESGAWT